MNPLSSGSSNPLRSHNPLSTHLNSSHQPHPQSRPYHSNHSNRWNRWAHPSAYPNSYQNIGPGCWSRRPPSRFLWFAIGASATALWINKNRESREHFGYSPCRRVGLTGVGTSDNDTDEKGEEQAHHAHWQRRCQSSAHQLTLGEKDQDPLSYNNLKKRFEMLEKRIEEAKGLGSGMGVDGGKAVEKHVENVSRQAMDTMVEITEATLESVLSTAEALKVKVAEHKAAREEQQKVLKDTNKE